MIHLQNPALPHYFDHMVNQRHMGERIYGFMKEQASASGIVPTTREIAAHFGLKSHGTVLYHLTALKRSGRVLRQGRRWGLAELGGLHEIPIYGSIPAGFAEDASQESENAIRMDLAALGIHPRGPTFLLRVHGDSMEGARIFDGDLALMERAEPRPGQIVAALIDGQSTLKTYLLRRGVPYLRPENPKYPDLIPARDLEIQGVLLLALRQP